MRASWSNGDLCLSDLLPKCRLEWMVRWRRNFKFWAKFTLQVTSLVSSLVFSRGHPTLDLAMLVGQSDRRSDCPSVNPSHFLTASVLCITVPVHPSASVSPCIRSLFKKMIQHICFIMIIWRTNHRATPTKKAFYISVRKYLSNCVLDWVGTTCKELRAQAS